MASGYSVATPPVSGRGLAGSAAQQETDSSLDAQLTLLLNSNSSKEFSVASYLNLALADAAQASAASSGGDDLQQRMAEMALQLQLQTQSCHEDIGRIGAELQAILPRCHADVGRVGVGLEGMKMDAAALLESTSAKTESEEEVETSLETLSTLHALQSNLSRTKDILTAAATWDSTLSSVAPLLAQQNLTEAVTALAQLENGERALRGMPHPEERRESIARIRQQVSVLLQPQLKHALQNMNTRLAPLQQCVSLYMKLGKMDALKEEYIKNRPMPVHKAWFAYTPSYDTTATQGGGGVGNDGSSKETFLTWLPGWYETVLTLITEERRQSLAVFGSDLVPEIVVKVLRECFRPILPSFQSRLESMYSSNPSIGPSPNKGSLENISAVYEATLQFLSLAYENVAGGWLDLMESQQQQQQQGGGGLSSENGISLYNDMASIFLQVASPFSLYQERLALLEAKHSSVTAKLVAADIQQAVSAVSEGSADPTSLQDATDRLTGLTTFVFPLAEGALARFELMNGGFHVRQSLATMDGLIAGHASEISTAIRSLSTSMTSNEKKLAENFDDQHVLCALEVLKVAGLFRRNMKSFEGKTQERLKVLAERMSLQVAKENKIEDTLSGAAKTSSDGPFQLPESVSVVEIDSFLTKAVCGSGESHSDMDEDADSATISLLETLAAGADQTEAQGSVVLYAEVDEAMQSLTNSCHKFVYDVCSSVPRLHLSGISTMGAWKEDSGADDIASYGTLPQNYVTHVGEHMLALVQALEPFASDADALSLANEVMDGVRGVSLQPWREFLSSAGSRESTDDVVKTLMDGEGILDLVINATPPEEEEDEEEEDEATRASTAFCNAWLDAVGLSVTGRLLERIVRIPQLTPKGCEHLSADLNYIVNVFSALGLKGHPHPLVSHIAELAMIEGDIFSERLANWDRTDPLQAALLCIEQRIALMRGIHN